MGPLAVSDHHLGIKKVHAGSWSKCFLGDMSKCATSSDGELYASHGE